MLRSLRCLLALSDRPAWPVQSELARGSSDCRGAAGATWRPYAAEVTTRLARCQVCARCTAGGPYRACDQVVAESYFLASAAPKGRRAYNLPPSAEFALFWCGQGFASHHGISLYLYNALCATCCAYPPVAMRPGNKPASQHCWPKCARICCRSRPCCNRALGGLDRIEFRGRYGVMVRCFGSSVHKGNLSWDMHQPHGITIGLAARLVQLMCTGPCQSDACRSEKTRVGKELSGALVATLIGLFLSNVGIIPFDSPEYNVVNRYLLPLAVPLLLLSADLRKVIRDTGNQPSS